MIMGVTLGTSMCSHYCSSRAFACPLPPAFSQIRKTFSPNFYFSANTKIILFLNYLLLMTYIQPSYIKTVTEEQKFFEYSKYWFTLVQLLFIQVAEN